ncbi:MAG TPA: glyceraldehyde 3-phosphate dehydrogenase NAD-binding domain-containing protein [Thermoanaerobaculia bacterium]|jgi:glyceraldehyde 3-phosphate dehydrogenase|nr:glyceraldehyde 3-phosphate dehydrogenase NAD-binding domain-containing protein [Thermoanaerobaculia bacterium]
MPLRYAINGLGRVGRALVRAARDRPEIELVAINDVVPAAVLARLVARDTIHGRYPGTVEATPGGLRLDGREIPVFASPEPGGAPWDRHEVAVVVEATGRFTRRTSAARHLERGVGHVVLSANSDPADPADATICLGLNAEALDPARQRVISNASCTTNCLALVTQVLAADFGVRRALMSTVHSYTENQRLLDVAHADPRRARAAALNVIPTATTAPGALAELVPSLAGRIEGLAIRVPTAAVAMLDLAVELERDATKEALAEAFRRAASGPLAGLLGVTDEELVSSDFIGDPRSAVVDLGLLQVADLRLARIVAWYDNEWGYAHRLAELLVRLAGFDPRT